MLRNELGDPHCPDPPLSEYPGQFGVWEEELVVLGVAEVVAVDVGANHRKTL